MELYELNPYIRYMDLRKCVTNYEKPVLAYDYRLFAVCEGQCVLVIEEKQFQLLSGSIVVFPPATPYCLLFENQAVLYDINFSLRYIPCKCIAPDTAERFEKSRMPENPDSLLFTEAVLSCGASILCRKIGDLLWEFENGNQPELCSAMLKEILLRILQHSNHSNKPASLTDQVASYLDLHCREVISGKQIGQIFGYHPYHLNRLFHNRFGCGMHRYQMECRMRRACSMLQGTRLTIREIAESLGFSQSSYFSEMFHALRGMTPTEFRQKTR